MACRLSGDHNSGRVEYMTPMMAVGTRKDVQQEVSYFMCFRCSFDPDPRLVSKGRVHESVHSREPPPRLLVTRQPSPANLMDSSPSSLARRDTSASKPMIPRKWAQRWYHPFCPAIFCPCFVYSGNRTRLRHLAEHGHPHMTRGDHCTCSCLGYAFACLLCLGWFPQVCQTRLFCAYQVNIQPRCDFARLYEARITLKVTLAPTALSPPSARLAL